MHYSYDLLYNSQCCSYTLGAYRRSATKLSNLSIPVSVLEYVVLQVLLGSSRAIVPHTFGGCGIVIGCTWLWGERAAAEGSAYWRSPPLSLHKKNVTRFLRKSCRCFCVACKEGKSLSTGDSWADCFLSASKKGSRFLRINFLQRRLNWLLRALTEGVVSWKNFETPEAGLQIAPGFEVWQRSRWKQNLLRMKFPIVENARIPSDIVFIICRGL